MATMELDDDAEQQLLGHQVTDLDKRNHSDQDEVVDSIRRGNEIDLGVNPPNPEHEGDFSDSDYDLWEESSDSDDESEFSDCDDEDTGPNLFESTALTLNDNSIVVTDVCSISECKKALISHSECVKHIRTCPTTSKQSVLVRSNPITEVTEEGKEACEHRGEAFHLATSLQMHNEACHAEYSHRCLHEDCQSSTVLYNQWGLNLHCFETRDGLLSQCTFPSCEHRIACRGPASRRQGMIVHLVRVHAIVTASSENLYNLDLKDVEGRRNTPDSRLTYVDISADAEMSASLALPEAIVDDCQLAGACHNPTPDSSAIYEELRHRPYNAEDDLFKSDLAKLFK
ncbi:Fc.00g021990.m01.CDS01 [Cosmosporella sp. VM-42]